MATVYDLLNADSSEVEEQRVIRAPGATSGDVLTVQANGTIDPAPGGSTPVSCTLACDTNFDVHSVGNYDILWDALYDNLWDLNPLAAIPAGLGLTFAFDGSSSLVAATEAGIWSLSYFAARVADISLGCTLRNGGVGIDFPWVQPIENVTDTASPFLAASQTVPLPAGTQMTHQVATVHGGANNPSNVTQVYLSIVRLG